MTSLPAQRSGLRQIILAGLAALIIVAAQMAVLKTPLPEADSMDYMKRAVLLVERGVYSDASPLPAADQPVPPGRYVAPAYPAFLAGVMLIDDRFAATAACAARQYFIEFEATVAVCGQDGVMDWGWLLFPLQGTLAALSLLVVWTTARLLGASHAVAWTAMGVAALAGIYGQHPGHFLTEALVLPLGSALMAALACLVRRPRARTALAVGVLLGLAALVRPTFTYAFYIITAATLLVALRPAQRRPALAAALVIVAGYAVVAGPWMLRNLTLFSDPGITGGYAYIILAQRVAYNAMTWTEWLAAFVYWLPDFGDDLGRRLFGQAVVERLDWFSPNSYYVLSLGEWRQAYIAAAGGQEHVLGWLIREGILGDLAKHIAVTVPMVLRGLWVSNYFGLIGALFLFPALIRGCRKGDWTWLAFCAVPVFLLGLHAFISPSIPRYNLLLVPCMAIAAAPGMVAAGRWILRIPSYLRSPRQES